MLYYNIFKKLINKKIILILLITVLLFSLHYNKNNLILETSTSMRESINEFQNSVNNMADNLTSTIQTADKFVKKNTENANLDLDIEGFIENMDCENINMETQSEEALDVINAQCNITNEIIDKNDQ